MLAFVEKARKKPLRRLPDDGELKPIRTAKRFNLHGTNRTPGREFEALYFTALKTWA